MKSDVTPLSRPTVGIEGLCETVRKWAELQPCVAKAWVYGSRARGEETPESDLDVAVEIQWHEGLQLKDESIDWKIPVQKARYDSWEWQRQAEIVTQHIEPSLGDNLSVELDLRVYFGPDRTPTIHSGLEESSKMVYS